MYLTDGNYIFSKIIFPQTHTRLKTMDIGQRVLYHPAFKEFTGYRYQKYTCETEQCPYMELCGPDNRFHGGEGS